MLFAEVVDGAVKLFEINDAEQVKLTSEILQRVELEKVFNCPKIEY